MNRQELRAHLVRHRIAGNVATPRASNVGNVRKMLARDPDYWFGVDLDREWTYGEVVAIVAARAGIDADDTRESGEDAIDPDLCLDALDLAAERLARVAVDGGTVVLATGHPTGLLEMYMTIAVALAAAGCSILTPGAESWVSVHGTQRRIRYVGGVATIGTGGDLLHTHSPEPMASMLAELSRTGEGPALVVADHGWAGAAGQAGLATIGFADTNDPALFVAAEQGSVEVVVPLDDNVAPAAYVPLTSYLLRRLTVFGSTAPG